MRNKLCKGLMAVWIIIILMLLSYASTVYAQDPTKDDRPTFYRLIPGVYVNPWPRFTITYPRDWVEHPNSLGFL